MKSLLFRIKRSFFSDELYVVKYFLLGKILDFFTVAEIRRSNSFKAVGRVTERIIVGFSDNKDKKEKKE